MKDGSCDCGCGEHGHGHHGHDEHSEHHGHHGYHGSNCECGSNHGNDCCSGGHSGKSWRKFVSKEEKKAHLEHYMKELEAELTAVKEILADL